MSVDTSTKAVERLADFYFDRAFSGFAYGGTDSSAEWDTIMKRRAMDAYTTLRALAAERDAAFTRANTAMAMMTARGTNRDYQQARAEKAEAQRDADRERVKKRRGKYQLAHDIEATAAAEVVRLREALENIEDGHVPDQPMTAPGDAEMWARQHVGKLRGIARAALAAPPAVADDRARCEQLATAIIKKEATDA